jgi:hypothetical protein
LILLKIEDQQFKLHILQLVDLTLKVFNCLKRTAEGVVSVKGVTKTKNLLPIQYLSEGIASSKIPWQRRGLVLFLSLRQSLIESHYTLISVEHTEISRQLHLTLV